MGCFFIGEPEKKIFANLTEPRRPNDKDAVVVLCYPFGQEYMRAHRAFRQLATMLGRSGFYSLRFDYPSSGDSYGDEPIQSFSGLIDELNNIVTEAKQRSGLQNVYICGLRFGALVAAKLAQVRNDIKCLCLWDSYASGQLFLDDCANQMTASTEEKDAWWVHGFPLARSFRQDISSFDFSYIDSQDDLKICHVISHESHSSALLHKRFKNRLKQYLVPSNGDWNYVDVEGSILMPTQLVKKITNVLQSVD